MMLRMMLCNLSCQIFHVLSAKTLLPISVRSLPELAAITILQPERFAYNFGLKSCESRARAMGTHFVYFCETKKLQLESRSSGSGLLIRPLYLKLAHFELELRERTSCTFALKSCDARISSWSCGSALTVRLLYLRLRLRSRSSEMLFACYFCTYNMRAFRECTSRTTFVLKKRGFTAGAPGMLFARYFWYVKA